MKNLITWLPELIDELDLRRVFSRDSRRFYDDRWDSGKHQIYPIKHIWPHRWVDIVCKKYLGQHINEAFKYYCTIVPKHHQHIFWKEFYRNRKYGWSSKYDYDEQGIIVKVPQKKKQAVIFYSIDFEEKWRHKITKLFKDDLFSNYRHFFNYYNEPGAFKEKFELVTVSGFKKEFSSTRDPEYKRLTAEKNKELNKRRRLERIKKEQENWQILLNPPNTTHDVNRRKIISHGFDTVTSFRKDKQL